MKTNCYTNEVKTSVLIVAHNEEMHIRDCLKSVHKQTVVSDEIVVICHNCTDNTVSIAQSFPDIKTVEYNGVPYARIKGFEEVTGDIIACLDGDGTVSPLWPHSITAPLIEDRNVSLVAGYVILTTNFFARLTSFWQFIFIKKILHMKLNTFAWGSNFACRKTDYEKVGGIKSIIKLRETLSLHFWAEDFYISLALMQIGKIYFALSAKSYTQIPYWKINPKTAPLKEWRADN